MGHTRRRVRRNVVGQGHRLCSFHGSRHRGWWSREPHGGLGHLCITGPMGPGHAGSEVSGLDWDPEAEAGAQYQMRQV